MYRFALFGVLPITFTPDGTWCADTGNRLTDVAANVVARWALSLVAMTEGALNIQIPVRIVPLDQPGSEQISA